MQTWTQDLRVTCRSLRKQPGYTFAAIVALALGIGGVVSVASVINTVLLTPLPYPDPDRLIYLRQSIPGVGSRLPFPPYLYEELQESARGVESLAGFDRVFFNLGEGDEPVRVPGAQISSNFFQMLGVRPTLGRGFRPEDESPAEQRVAVVSHRLWERTFGGRVDIVGLELKSDATTTYGPPRSIPETLVVIGVLPESFREPWGDVDIWTPLVLDRERGYRFPFLMMMARLSDGQAIEQASTELNASYQAIEYQDSLPAENRTLDMVALPEMGVENIRGALFLLWTASSLVLLIACANVAHLLLARSTRREGEMAMRAVMGAGRFRLVRLLLMESSFLAILGSVAGLGLAYIVLELVKNYGPTTVPRLTDARIDGSMLLFTVATASLTTLLFGWLPAFKASRPDLGRMLQGVGRNSSGGPGHSRVRSLLVIAEVALSLLLLISASLVIESFFRLQQVDSGYEPEDVLVLRLELPRSRYPERAQSDQTIRELLRRYTSVPGVVSVGAVNSLPLSNVHFSKLYRMQEAKESAEAPHRAALCFTSPRYLETMGVRLLRGRFLKEEDVTHPPRVVVVNQMLAREGWEQGDPIGERLWLEGEEGPPLEIVGVVANVRRRQMDTEAEPAMYIPRLPSPSVSFVVRTTADPLGSARALKHETAMVDKRLPVYDVATLEERLQTETSQNRFQSMLMLAFSGVALALAIVGVYGVMSYSVVSRRHEIGVRKALGAGRRDVLLMVLRQALLVSAAGVLLGLLSAFLLTGFLESMLFGISSRDARVFFAAPAVVLLVGVVASWFPARRAASVDPNHALRSS